MKKNKLIVLLCLILAFSVVLTLITGCGKKVKDEKSVTITEETVTVVLGESHQLGYEIKGLDELNLVWESSDSKIVSVANGKVTANDIGTVVITAKNGTYQDTCTVNVMLGTNTPILRFKNSDSDISLVEGQSFEIETYITYNNKEYTNFVLTADCDNDVLDYKVTGNIIAITAKACVNATALNLKASWNGVDGEGITMLNATFNIVIKEDIFFKLNGLGVSDLVLYSLSELDGKTYSNSYNANLKVYKSGEEIDNAQVDITISDESIAKLVNGKIVALKNGETTATISYDSGTQIYRNTFKITVLLPTVEYVDDTPRTFSLLDNELDMTGLKGKLSDVYALEINDKKVEIDGRQFPKMELVHSSIGTVNFEHNSNYTLQLTVEGLAKPITINQLVSERGFEPISMTLHMNSGYIYVLKNVQVFSQLITDVQDLVSVFGQKGKLNGYYALGGHVDATTATLTGAIRAKQMFNGIFDGRGYTISNLDISTTGRNIGSLFGNLDSNAVVRNVGLINVKADGAAVITAQAAYNKFDFGDYYPAPMISNVYVKVSEETTNFYGIVGGGPSTTKGHARINNVIVDYLGNITGDDTTTAKGAFIGYTSDKLTEESIVANDCYLISNEYITTLNGAEAYNFTDIVRYKNATAMKNANNDYSTFNYCWIVVSGEIPVWSKFGDASTVPVDKSNRSYSTVNGTLDLTGLNVKQADITAIEINGTKLSVSNGVFPSMSLVHSTVGAANFEHNSEYTLQLTINGIENPIVLSRSADGKYFDALKFVIYTQDATYILNNVHVYSNVINTADELEAFFGQTGELSGYYVLGGDIDASTVTLTGAKRANQKFTGIFDGMGHTISNLDISSTNNKKGSLFGHLDSNAVVRNVGIINVKSNGAAVIAQTAAYNESAFGGYPAPMISNVYVKVSEETTDFYGIVGRGPNTTKGHVRLNNVIVEYSGNITGDDTTTAKGAFIGYTDYLTENSIVAYDCYLISKEYITTLNNAEAYTFGNITRYSSITAMKNANNDYSTFNYCWTVVDGGIPVWGGYLEDDPVLPPLTTDFGVGDFNINWLKTDASK